MGKQTWLQRLADGAELSDEMLPGVPVVEIAGEHRVLIERHGGVNEYSRERIGVKVRYGTVYVCGQGLELTCMSASQLVISGQIGCVQLQRRNI
jgi:sporulation protein YqfC